MEFALPLFLLIVAAVCGGVLARIFKLPPLVGYILAGLAFGSILPAGVKNVAKLSEVGTILLLFSIGLELSLSRLTKFLKVAVFGSLLQIALVSGISYFLLIALGFGFLPSLVLALGFSLSSTAVVVKILGDRGELDSLHGGIMTGWLLVQDLAVIPMMVALPVLGQTGGGVFLSISLSLAKALLVVLGAVLLGKTFAPYLIHKIASVNSRELLTLSSVALALGTAAATSFMGISPALGAFLAGVVISDSQENHAVFAETRPLRDLFVALFFVSLGFLISPSAVFSSLGIIVFLTFLVLVLKAVVVFLVTTAFGFRGKTAIANALGLSQIGEFAFVIFGAALSLGLISQRESSVGVTVGLLTLIFTPALFASVVPVWRRVKKMGGIFLAGEKKYFDENTMENHIIICGYGRVGSWIGRALSEFKIPFVVVEYNQEVVGDLKKKGIPVLYGDPGEPEVLESVGIKSAKALVLAIPDEATQEDLITYVQTQAPGVKIISRVHQDSDWEKLKTLRVDRIVQPEFEAAIAIIRGILTSMGKPKEEISLAVKGLRVSHSK